MNKLRSCFLYRLLASYVLCRLWLLGFRLAARVRGLHRLRVGSLSVWGDAGFLSLCRGSIERLARLDGSLHHVLTEGRWVWIFQAPEGWPYIGNLGPPWLFSLEPAYAAWQSDGIIARLVYIGFCISEFPTGHTSRAEAEDRHKIVVERSRSWLACHSFPDQLVDCYRDHREAQQHAPPKGGPATQSGNPKVTEGPPSVS